MLRLTPDVLVMVEASMDSASEPMSKVPVICCSRDDTGTCLDSEYHFVRENIAADTIIDFYES